MSLVTANVYGLASLTFVSPLYQPTNLQPVLGAAVRVTFAFFTTVVALAVAVPFSPAVTATVQTSTSSSFQVAAAVKAASQKTFSPSTLK